MGRKMKKVVINRCYGSFGLSHKAILRYSHNIGLRLFYDPSTLDSIFHNYYTEKSMESKHYWSSYDIKRDDPTLVAVVEELREETNARFADLEVVEIPDDIEWDIEGYGGIEWVSENHRTWP